MIASQKRYDAGQEREELSLQLARWLAAGYETTERANAFYRRVAKLASVLHTTAPRVHTVLRADADILIDEGAVGT